MNQYLYINLRWENIDIEKNLMLKKMILSDGIYDNEENKLMYHTIYNKKIGRILEIVFGHVKVSLLSTIL